MKSLNPYSNGSYFLTSRKEAKEKRKIEYSLNPYSNGSYFLTYGNFENYQSGRFEVLILILMEVTF